MFPVNGKMLLFSVNFWLHMHFALKTNLQQVHEKGFTHVIHDSRCSSTVYIKICSLHVPFC